MKLPSIQKLVKIELALGLLTVVLYLATMNANDFSGLIIIFPILGMAFTAVLAFIVFIVNMFNNAGKTQTMKSRLLSLGGLLIFSVPVYAVFWSGLADEPLYTRTLLVFLAALSLYILVNDKLAAWRKPYEIMLLTFAPAMSVIYARDTNNTMPYFWLAIGFGIFAIGCARVLRQR